MHGTKLGRTLAIHMILLRKVEVEQWRGRNGAHRYNKCEYDSSTLSRGRAVEQTEEV